MARHETRRISTSVHGALTAYTFRLRDTLQLGNGLWFKAIGSVYSSWPVGMSIDARKKPKTTRLAIFHLRPITLLSSNVRNFTYARTDRRDYRRMSNTRQLLSSNFAIATNVRSLRLRSRDRARRSCNSSLGIVLHATGVNRVDEVEVREE